MNSAHVFFVALTRDHLKTKTLRCVSSYDMSKYGLTIRSSDALNTHSALFFYLMNGWRFRVIILSSNAVVNWYWGCLELVIQGFVCGVLCKMCYPSEQQLLSMPDPLYQSSITVLPPGTAVSLSAKRSTHHHGILVLEKIQTPSSGSRGTRVSKRTRSAFHTTCSMDRMDSGRLLRLHNNTSRLPG